uniref:Aspartate beta-hydroxylase n=1 Tax=Callorhinchus milii TaxID=7868 RepID=A0A4W3K565_CALMI
MADDADKPTPLNKNGKKSDGPSGSSFFTWFMIIALLGVWTSVAVVWFDLVDYEDVLAKAKEFRYNLSEVLQGKLGVYDADGDGDFDMEDAKVLLGLTKGDGNNDQIDTLEEVLDTIAEETSDWAYGFFSFLFDVMTPFEILEDEENEASKDVAEEEPGGKLKAKEKAKAKGLKERAAPAAPAGKTEEPVHHSVNIPLETAETQAEDSEPEPEPLQASETHADLRSEPEEAVEEEEEEEELEPELAEETEEDVAAETGKPDKLLVTYL